ncbi:MAG: hypothetical protein H8E21_12485 [Gammaproteobacteria bacterium]|nr:hypothetical protein [Gammaproteobacteria bacterium]
MKKVNYCFLTLIAATALLTGCSDDETSASSTNGNVSGTSNSVGLGPSVPTGIVSHRDFRIGFDPGIALVFDSQGNFSGGDPVSIVIRADDIKDLVVDGQTVNIRTEWGTFTDDKDSCVLQNGTCFVTWLPGSSQTAPSALIPSPAESAECRVAFTAWTRGEEKFSDANGNGVLDVGEVFTDLPEPYLDINETGLYSNFNGYVSGWDAPGYCNSDRVCEMIDTNGNRLHDEPDGKYNGTLCASGNPDCSTNTSTLIWTTHYLLISAQTTLNCSGFKGS